MATERALLGVDAIGNVIVLATDGVDTETECDQCGSTDAEVIGLYWEGDWLPPGLFLWTGAWERSTNVPGGLTVRGDGTVRAVKPEEVAELYAMEPPETLDEDDPGYTPGGD